MRITPAILAYAQLEASAAEVHALQAAAELAKVDLETRHSHLKDWQQELTSLQRCRSPH